jgi:hypothetical protein
MNARQHNQEIRGWNLSCPMPSAWPEPCSAAYTTADDLHVCLLIAGACKTETIIKNSERLKAMNGKLYTFISF